MKRLYIAGLTWQLANQPCLLLSNVSSEYIVSFPCDPFEVSLFFKIARREQGTQLPLLLSATAKVLAQTYMSITSIELLEFSRSANKAILNLLANDGVLQKIELSCMEALALALVFDRPIFAEESMLQPVSTLMPEIAEQMKQQDSKAFSSFVENVKPADFSSYAETKQLGNNS